jgi:hypothetical protein
MMSLLLHVTTRKMPNLLDIYNTYIEYIKEASFCGLTMRSSALERYPKSGDPCMTQACLDFFRNSGCSSYEVRYMVDLLYRAHWRLTSADPLQTLG